MKMTTETITHDDMHELVEILDKMYDAYRNMSKSTAVALILYEALSSMSEVPYRIGQEALSDTAEIICEYSNLANTAIKNIYDQFNEFYKINHNILYPTDNK